MFTHTKNTATSQSALSKEITEFAGGWVGENILTVTFHSRHPVNRGVRIYRKYLTGLVVVRCAATIP